MNTLHAVPRPLARTSPLARFVNEHGVRHQLLVITVSYLFVFAGAWNDGFVGLQPSGASTAAESIMALVLLAEIVTRVAYTRRKRVKFWTVVAFDLLSLLTLVPMLKPFSFARLVRMFWAVSRLAILLDRVSRQRANPAYLIALYPTVVPLMAVIVYVLERHSPGSAIHTYPQALSVCLAFALSLGNIRPTSPWSMTICGCLFLAGIVCISVFANALSARYIASAPSAPRTS